MNVSFENVDKVSAVLTIKMEKADYADKVKKSLKKYQQQAQMPGFRVGHVPMALIEKRVGASIKGEEVEKLLSDTLFSYIRDNKVNMLGQPLQSEKQEAQDIEKQDDFEFLFDIALAPEFKAALSDKDTIVYYDIQVEDTQVDEQVKNLTRQASTPVSAEEYAEGDILRGQLIELENGSAKEGGIVIEKASLMPQYFSDEASKKLFAGAKKGEVITLNPSVAYNNNESEIAALLRIKKEEAGNHNGEFTFQVDEISRMVPAALNQEFFDRIYGEGTVKNEEEFRARIKSEMEQQFSADSDYRFLLDTRNYLTEKVGKLEFPDALLKRIMAANNKDKDDKYIEDNYAKSIEELQWHLTKEQLVEANKIKIDDNDLLTTAIQAARFQFAQYGMNNIPDEYLKQYAENMLKDENQRTALLERAIDTKLTGALKNVVTLEHKATTLEEFNKLFEQK